MRKVGRKIMLSEKELRNIEEKRNHGFVWKEIGKNYDCSVTTVRKRYKEWKNDETEFDEYTRMTWIEKVKYAFNHMFRR